MHNIRKIISSQLSVIKKTLARCVDQRFQSNVKVVIKRLFLTILPSTFTLKR